MRLHKIASDGVAKTLRPGQALRNGQIIQGEIVKIYPNQKAQIKFGNQQLVAKLEASLMVGGKYHFQVKTMANIVYLQVIGEKLRNQPKQDISSLLQQLGLKANKTNVLFMQKLMKEGTAFSKPQITQALPLLDGVKDKKQAQEVLQEMISRKLPITDSVFKALYTHKTNGQSDLIHQLLLQIKNDPNHTKLDQQLNQLIRKPLDENASIIHQVKEDISRNSQQFFHVLKAAGILDSMVAFSSWKSSWNASINQPFNQKQETLPFRLNQLSVVPALEQITLNKDVLVERSNNLIQNWQDKIAFAITRNTALSNEDFSLLKQELIKLTEKLPIENQPHQWTKIPNKPENLSQVMEIVRTLRNENTYSTIDRLLTSIKIDRSFLQVSPKEQFIQQLTQYMKLMDFSYGHKKVNSEVNQQDMIKNMLFQFISQSSGSVQEHGEKLLQFVQGMQLNAVSETDNFIQASIQIPAERLGLHKDIELNFESKKTEDGKINPDFCRILFYLDLKNLKETIIDMNIRQRSIFITVYNEDETLKTKTTPLQPSLKKGLEGLNYHLASIQFKSLNEQKEQKKISVEAKGFASYQGVDFRV